MTSHTQSTVFALLANRIVEMNQTAPLYKYCPHSSGRDMPQCTIVVYTQTHDRNTSYQGSTSCYGNRGLERVLFLGLLGNFIKELIFYLSLRREGGIEWNIYWHNNNYHQHSSNIKMTRVSWKTGLRQPTCCLYYFQDKEPRLVYGKKTAEKRSIHS